MSHEGEMVLWLSSSSFREQPRGWERSSSAEGTCGSKSPPREGSACAKQLFLAGRGKMARACKEMASVVATQLFLESAQLPPRSSSCVTHAMPAPQGGRLTPFRSGDIFLEV